MGKKVEEGRNKRETTTGERGGRSCTPSSTISTLRLGRVLPYALLSDLPTTTFPGACSWSAVPTVTFPEVCSWKLSHADVQIANQHLIPRSLFERYRAALLRYSYLITPHCSYVVVLGWTDRSHNADYNTSVYLAVLGAGERWLGTLLYYVVVATERLSRE